VTPQGNAGPSGGVEPGVAAPRIRAEPEDFVVEELPLYPAAGEGGHTFLFVEKRLRTTEEVARTLARQAGVAARDVGYAGRKDRVAVTRQWFSVPLLDPETARGLSIAGARVLEAARHPHKLRTGHLRANRFEILLREVSPSHREHIEAAVERVRARGFPNRFGPQRFGRDGDNAGRAAALLRGEVRVRDRRSARFLCSALQSAVFNEALRTRSVPGDRVERGDVAMVDGSGGLFVVEDPDAENARAARLEIHPTGPIFGSRVIEPQGEPLVRELAARAALGVPAPGDLRPPAGVRLRGARRRLRVYPEALEIEARDGEVRLRFALPSGSYATVLLDELVGPVRVGPA
jgi:tRNA pseudouridine13 synthase